MYTQCPSCRAYFRISEQQLAAAKGKVRCGKCNHIYNAQGTLIDELPQQAAAPTPPAKPEPEVKPAPIPTPSTPQVHQFESFDIASARPEVSDNQTDDSWQEPDFNIVSESSTPSNEDLDDDWLFGDDETEIPSISHLEQNLDADDVQVVNLGSDSSFSSELEDDDDDDWLFDDDNGLPGDAQDDSGVDIVLRDEGDEVEEYDDVDIVLGGTEPEPAPVIETAAIEEPEEDDSDFMHHMSDYLDDDKADELISDESAADIFSEVNQQLNLSIENPEPEPAKPAQGIDLPGEWMDDFDQAINSELDDEISDEEKERQELNDAILKGLETPSPQVETEPEPVVEQKTETPDLANASFGDVSSMDSESIVLEAAEELDIGHKIGQHDNVPLRIRDSVGIEEQQPRSGLKWLGISSAAVGLLFVLAIQAVMFRSVDLANMYPDLQPTLVNLCETLPCRDSRPLNIDQVRLLSRNISQHPKTKSALLIKAAIINRANFAQRYPKIQITLSDVTGDTVAQRIFYPQEYLGSLYHPFLTMKPSTPIHIALEVMDPGSAAINFEFQFL